MHFLVIGIGSIGTRHIKNLRSLGVEVSVFDKNVDIFQPHISLPDSTPQLSRLEELVREYDVHYADPNNRHVHYDAWIICTPPSSHLEYIVKGMQQFSHIFVEKPISHEMEYLDWVVQTSRNKDIIVQVGYQLRFHPGLVLMKKMLDDGVIGKLLSIRAEFGQYLPLWHPGQDYKTLYTGKKEEGGGIILDASHEIDYVRWLVASPVKKVSCYTGHLSELEIDVEDTADILLEFEDKIIGNIHVDMVQKNYTRKCKLIGETGELEWHYPENVICQYGIDKCIYHSIGISDPYLDEMAHFIKCVEEKTAPLVDACSGKKTLEIVSAAKQSAKESKVICL